MYAVWTLFKGGVGVLIPLRGAPLGVPPGLGARLGYLQMRPPFSLSSLSMCKVLLPHEMSGLCESRG